MRLCAYRPIFFPMYRNDAAREFSQEEKGKRKNKNTKSYPMTTRVYTLTGNSFRMQWSARARLSRFNVWTDRGNVLARSIKTKFRHYIQARQMIYLPESTIIYSIRQTWVNSTIFQNGGSSWNLKNKKKASASQHVFYGKAKAFTT
jgi:hypothetical protein